MWHPVNSWRSDLLPIRLQNHHEWDSFVEKSNSLFQNANSFLNKCIPVGMTYQLSLRNTDLQLSILSVSRVPFQREWSQNTAAHSDTNSPVPVSHKVVEGLPRHPEDVGVLCCITVFNTRNSVGKNCMAWECWCRALQIWPTANQQWMYMNALCQQTDFGGIDFMDRNQMIRVLWIEQIEILSFPWIFMTQLSKERAHEWSWLDYCIL